MTFKKTILIILAGLLVLIAGLAITITLLMPPGKTPVPGKQWPALSLAPDLPEALRGALMLGCFLPLKILSLPMG